MSGSCSASRPSAACSAVAAGGIPRDHRRLERRRGEHGSAGTRRRAPDGVPDADVLQAREQRDLPGLRRVADPRATGREHPDRGDRALTAASERQPVADGDPAREHPDVGDLAVARTALDVEHRPRRRRGRVAAGEGEQRRDAAQELGDAGARDRGPEEHGVDLRRGDLRGEPGPQVPGSEPAALDRGAQQRLVVVDQGLVERVGEVLLVVAVRGEPRAPGPGVTGPAHGDRPEGEALADRLELALGVRAGALTKSTVGMRRRASARMSTTVWACTPSTAETTSTAPSSTLRDRSTSAMKSVCPGVS
jgi:hypothetical protein